MRKLLNERTGCLIAGQCEKEKTFGAASEGLFYSLCAAGLEVYQRIKSFHNAQGFTLKQPHDNVRSYSHSIVRNYLQFVPVCRSLLQFVLFTPGLKNCRESMGSNLGHGSQGGAGQFRGPHGVMKTTSGNRWLQMCYKPKEGRCGWGVYASPPSPGA